ncbi:hypothetical protein SKAU_G00150070 [Synaphobranchus kaupii]|uniref:Uncharacterized protein n=1 Tax=Synaphobranchus kaupii TaxID=118154 RepID=A0A9Q1FTW1_SYNKA|nr:hypothetical protein SKAU_G00150070 [Synaphobranchus kaupii]
MTSLQDMLLTKLRQLECHFTWGLDDTDLTYLQHRLKNNIELAEEEDRNIGWSYSNQAFTKYMQGHLEEARDDLAKAEQHIREQHGDNCRAFLKFSRQYYEKAKECFEKALELQPEEIEWNDGYAVALYRTESDLTSLEESPASKQLRRVLELDPNNAYMMVLLGLKHADYKKYQKAEELIERAMELEPDKPYMIQYVAKYYRKKGEVEVSLSLLKRLLEKIPDSPFVHHQLALVYNYKKINSGQNGGEEADALLRLRIQHLEKAISIKPSFVYAMSDLAACYAEEKNFQKAEEMFQETFKVATATNDRLHVVNLRYADFQLYHNKSEPLAIKHYKEGLTLQKNTAEGKKCAKKLTIIANKHISRNPYDGKAFWILGYVHEITGEKPQAIECYEKAILYDPGNEEYLNALYDLCLSLQ